MQIAISAKSSKILNLSMRIVSAQTKITNGPLSILTYADCSDYNYRRVDGKCELIGKERIISGKCDKEGDTYLASSGYRKIPGNTCIDPDSNRKDTPIEKECGKDGSTTPPSVPNGDIRHVQYTFPAGGLSYFYLERSETSSG